MQNRICTKIRDRRSTQPQKHQSQFRSDLLTNHSPALPAHKPTSSGPSTFKRSSNAPNATSKKANTPPPPSQEPTKRSPPTKPTDSRKNLRMILAHSAKRPTSIVSSSRSSLSTAALENQSAPQRRACCGHKALRVTPRIF